MGANADHARVGSSIMRRGAVAFVQGAKEPLHDHVLNAHDFAVVGARRGRLLRPDRHHLVPRVGRGGKVRQSVRVGCVGNHGGSRGAGDEREGGMVDGCKGFPA